MRISRACEIHAGLIVKPTLVQYCFYTDHFSVGFKCEQQSHADPIQIQPSLAELFLLLFAGDWCSCKVLSLG